MKEVCLTVSRRLGLPSLHKKGFQDSELNVQKDKPMAVGGVGMICTANCETQLACITMLLQFMTNTDFRHIHGKQLMDKCTSMVGMEY